MTHAKRNFLKPETTLVILFVSRGIESEAFHLPCMRLLFAFSQKEAKEPREHISRDAQSRQIPSRARRQIVEPAALACR